MQDLTTGSIPGHLIRTTSFMLVTMVFQTLYFLVDLYWVGSLGKEAVAGVGVAGNLTFIVLAISQMLGVGTTTLVSHAAGQRDQARALLVFNQSQLLSIGAGVVFLVAAMALRVPYATTLSADAATAAIAADYLRWFIPAMALQFALVAMSAALRGIGVFKPGMVVQTATVVLNLVLAPVLIFGWGTGVAMGAAGAAVASLVAVAVGVLWLATYFMGSHAYLRFVRRDMPPQWPLWRQILSIGTPAGAEFALMAVYMFLVYAISRPFGAAAQAGFGIGMRIVQALFMPVIALGFAVAPVAGQNVGARQAARVKAVFKTASGMAGAAMLASAAFCQLWPDALVRLFSNDPAVVAVGHEYLRIISFNFVASGVIFVSASMFQAMGNTVPSLVASFARITVVAVPALMLARLPGFQLRWIWLLSVAAVLLQLALVLTFLRREFRVRLNFETAASVPNLPSATPAPAVTP